jgi:hypothetical protein
LTPGTALEKSLCARKDSSPGTVIEWTSSHSLEPSLFQAKIEKDAGASVSHSASAEDIFSGCCWYISLPCQSPVRVTATKAASDTQPPSRTERRQTMSSVLWSAPSCGRAASFRRRRCHNPMPTSRAPATISAATIAWLNAASAVLLVSTAPMLTSCGVSPFISTPTGCCIQEFAAMMKYAETMEPITAAQSAARCTFFGIRPQPKIHRPRNVDSRKNASSASIASSEPKTSPTNREYSLQASPNWNSCTSPVATPRTKLIR